MFENALKEAKCAAVENNADRHHIQKTAVLPANYESRPKSSLP
jgi:hypothetical protein